MTTCSHSATDTSQLSSLIMLTEEIHLPRGSDARFYTKFKNKHKKNECFQCSKIRNDEFTICHYAGNVTYKVAGLLDKNKDSSNNSLQTLLEGAGPSFLRKEIFAISDLGGGVKPSISKRAVGMVSRWMRPCTFIVHSDPDRRSSLPL